MLCRPPSEGPKSVRGGRGEHPPRQTPSQSLFRAITSGEITSLLRISRYLRSTQAFVYKGVLF